MSTVLAILFSSALGRTLGAADFGLYFMLVSFSTFAYVVIDWGQQVYVTREAARRPERGSVLLGTVLVLRTSGAALVAVLSGLAVRALGYDAMTCWLTIAFIIVSLPFFLAQTYGTVFRARDRMGLDACVSVANKIALLLLALLALALHGGIPSVLAVQALAGVLALAFAARLYRRVTRSRLRYSSQIASELMVWTCPVFVERLGVGSV
jgi:O-antigen/teichoic acid export membrane protein